MKKILLLILILVAFDKGIAQQVVGEFDLSNKYSLKELEFVTFGDSALLNLSLHNLEVRRLEFKSLMMTPGKGFSSVPNLHYINEHPIVSVVSLSDSIKRVYFLDESNKAFTITALDIDTKNHSTKGITGELRLSGDFFGMDVRDKEVTIYSYADNVKTFYITVLNQLQIARQQSFELPFDMSTVSRREISFIRENDQVGAEQAKANVKIFLSKNFVTVTYDVYTIKSHTRVVTFDRNSDRFTEVIIPNSVSGGFCSAVRDTLLYRTINDKNYFLLQVYNSKTAKELYSKKIERTSETENQKVYIYVGEANRLSKTETLANMIKVSRLCESYVAVNGAPDGSHIITWGTYINANGGVSPVGANPMAAIVTMMVGTTVRQLIKGPGTSRYFYLTGNLGSGFEIVDDPDFLKVKIDAFEIFHQKSKTPLHSLGYFWSNDGVIAVYKDKKNKKLLCVKFAS